MNEKKGQRPAFRVTYDKSANAAYIYLNRIRDGEISKTVDALGSMLLNLDFDRGGRLRGIEVLNASLQLPKSLLAKAERIDERSGLLRRDKPRSRRTPSSSR